MMNFGRSPRLMAEIDGAETILAPIALTDREHRPFRDGLGGRGWHTGAGEDRCRPTPMTGQIGSGPNGVSCALSPSSSTRQLSAPPKTAPVSMPIRLARTSIRRTGVWPCTTTAP